MTKINELFEEFKTNKEKPCEFVFRCRINEYVSDKTICKKIEFRLMKSMSCLGCEKCWDGLFNDIRESGDLSMIYWPDNPKNGVLYKAICITEGYDYETGYADDWHWELKEIKDKDKI